MKARMLSTLGRRARPFATLVIVLLASGCSTMARKHEANRIPQYGVVDPHQPPSCTRRRSRPISLSRRTSWRSRYVPRCRRRPSTFVVQADGFVNLAFAGDVFVAGMTLNEAEERIAQHLTEQQKANNGESKQNYEVSVRLATNQSKFYYVMGAVGNQGRFKLTGNETVLDAILQAGLRSNSLPDKAYVSRPHPAGGPDIILKVDWFGIRDRGDTLTNYQILPGDRVIVPGTKPPGVLGSLLGG